MPKVQGPTMQALCLHDCVRLLLRQLMTRDTFDASRDATRRRDHPNRTCTELACHQHVRYSFHVQVGQRHKAHAT